MEPASGNRSTQVFDSAGEVIATIDPLGDRTSYGYDLRGLQVTTTNPLGNVWTVALDAVGNAVAMTTPRGNTTTTTFDADNRPIAIIQPTGGGIATQIYDAVGNRTVSIDQLGNRTTTAFDAVNRPVSVTQPTGAVGTVVYDGVSNVLSTIDGMGEVTSYGFDALNRQVTTTDPLGNVTTTILDAVGQQTGLIDASGNRTTWAYDAAGNMISMTDSLNHTTTSTFDGANQLTSATERNGRRIDYGYDLAGNETTQKWYTSLGTLTQTNTFAYDAAGRETVAADPSGTYTLAYNAASQVTSVQEPFGLVLTMGYDTDGNRTSVQDSTGGIVTSIYDAMDRLSTRETVTSSGGLFTTGIRFDYAYNARGDVVSLTRASLFGSVVDTTSFTYDSGDRLTNEKETGSSGSVLSNNTYTYDLADRMTSKTENGTTTSYSYDAASQLTQDGSATFGYDKTGNRTNAGDVTGAGNELSTDGTYTYTYDNNGNVIQQTQGANGPTWYYSYNNDNQLESADLFTTPGAVSLTQALYYEYDAWGNRIESSDTVGSTTTYALSGLDGWDTAKPQAVGNEGFDTWATLNGSLTLTSRQLFGSGFAQPVASITAAGTVSWYLTDAEGSVRKVIDNSDNVLASATYSAYGAITGGSLADAYGYTGQRLDALTGLYSSGNGTRDYRPSTGTWMESDPLYPLTGPNAHEYGNNSPTNETDPSGMTSVTLGGSLSGGGASTTSTIDPILNQLPIPTQGGLLGGSTGITSPPIQVVTGPVTLPNPTPTGGTPVGTTAPAPTGGVTVHVPRKVSVPVTPFPPSPPHHPASPPPVGSSPPPTPDPGQYLWSGTAPPAPRPVIGLTPKGGYTVGWSAPVGLPFWFTDLPQYNEYLGADLVTFKGGMTLQGEVSLVVPTGVGNVQNPCAVTQPKADLKIQPNSSYVANPASIRKALKGVTVNSKDTIGEFFPETDALEMFHRYVAFLTNININAKVELRIVRPDPNFKTGSLFNFDTLRREQKAVTLHGITWKPELQLKEPSLTGKILEAKVFLYTVDLKVLPQTKPIKVAVYSAEEKAIPKGLVLGGVVGVGRGDLKSGICHSESMRVGPFYNSSGIQFIVPLETAEYIYNYKNSKMFQSFVKVTRKDEYATDVQPGDIILIYQNVDGVRTLAHSMPVLQVP